MGQPQFTKEDLFLMKGSRKNEGMPTIQLKNFGQVIDLTLTEVPGWADSIDLSVYAALDVTVPAGGTAPSWSEFFPYNLFSNVQVSIGGGPFINTMPYVFYLREKVMNPGWEPGYQGPASYGYTSNVAWSVPSLQATVGSTVENKVRFQIKIPLQVQHGSAMGFLPMGDGTTKVKLRLTVTNSPYGSDHYLNPIVGGTGAITAAFDGTDQSWVQPNIYYLTSPADGTILQPPTVGYLLNIQEATTNWNAAGSKTPIKFADPFKYLRLWHIFIDGTGAPTSTALSAIEIDYAPGAPKYVFDTPDKLQNYFNNIERMYKQALPTGVAVFDLWSGSDPRNPNGTEVIDGKAFTTFQTQAAVTQGTNVASPAKIITYAEALSPVGF